MWLPLELFGDMFSVRLKSGMIKKTLGASGFQSKARSKYPRLRRENSFATVHRCSPSEATTSPEQQAGFGRLPGVGRVTTCSVPSECDFHTEYLFEKYTNTWLNSAFSLDCTCLTPFGCSRPVPSWRIYWSDDEATNRSSSLSKSFIFPSNFPFHSSILCLFYLRATRIPSPLSTSHFKFLKINDYLGWDGRGWSKWIIHSIYTTHWKEIEQSDCYVFSQPAKTIRYDACYAMLTSMAHRVTRRYHMSGAANRPQKFSLWTRLPMSELWKSPVPSSWLWRTLEHCTVRIKSN